MWYASAYDFHRGLAAYEGCPAMKLLGTFCYVTLFWVSQSTFAQSKLNVAFGLSRPPYVISHPPSGLVYDKAQLVFKKMGVKTSEVFASNERLEVLLGNGQVDVAVEVQKNDPSLFYSAAFISYRNYLIAPSKILPRFKSYADLKGHTVCTWQGADRMLGPDFMRIKPQLKEYSEYPLQEDQVTAWIGGKCEVAIIDGLIFKYYSERNEGSLPGGRKVEDVRFYPTPTMHKAEWYVGFRSKALRDQFDGAVKDLKGAPEWETLLRKFEIEAAALPSRANK